MKSLSFKEKKKKRVRKISKGDGSVTIEVEADIVEADIENLVDSISNPDLVDTVRGDFSDSGSSKEDDQQNTLGNLFSSNKEEEKEEEKDTLTLGDIAGPSVEEQILQDLDKSELLPSIGDYSESIVVEEEEVEEPFSFGFLK